MPIAAEEKRSTLPYSRVYIDDDEPDMREMVMEFRLLYQGEIKSSGNESKPEAVHAIRRVLHPQLRRLWEANPRLQQLAIHLGNTYDPIQLNTEQERFDHGIQTMAQRMQIKGFQFIPLVTEDYDIKCSIDILLLRPEDKRFIFRQGDIDGQVKTIFDSLRVISTDGEASAAGTPTADETPFYCLLYDDRVISEVHVNADQLLLLPQHKALTANDAFAVIHVRIHHKRLGFDSWFD